MNRRWKTTIVVALLVLALVLAGCAPGNEKFDARPAGFWAGLWHGVISLITLIISLFEDNVHMYEMNNTGWWYDAGFLLGVLVISGGSVFGGGRRKSRQR